MKSSFILIASIACSMVFTSCSGGSEKFIGKWRSLARGMAGTVTIQKHGNVFESVPDNDPDQITILTYDKDRDVLVSQDGDLEISYIAKNKHLKVGPAKGQYGMSAEMEKAE